MQDNERRRCVKPLREKRLKGRERYLVCNPYATNLETQGIPVGFNDDTFAQMMQPYLTTIRQPLYEAGIEAVKRLLPVSSSGAPVSAGLSLEPELVVRESTKRVGRGG